MGRLAINYGSTGYPTGPIDLPMGGGLNGSFLAHGPIEFLAWHRVRVDQCWNLYHYGGGAEMGVTYRTPTELETIAQAKRHLMHKYGIDEPMAYAALRRTAMDQKKTIVQIAIAIVRQYG